MTKEVQVDVVTTKHKPQATTGKLILGILFDLIGMASYTIPVLAEVTDIIWAPIAAFAMSMLYKGSIGKIGGIVAFIEEIVPGLDFIPTFTLTWLYEYFQDKKKSI